MNNLISVLCLLVLFSPLSGCKKDENSQVTIPIKGRLLQSSSNPVPVSNYRLGIYEPLTGGKEYFFPDLGPLNIVTTDNNGNFEGEITMDYYPVVVNGESVEAYSLAGIDSSVNSFVVNNFYDDGNGNIFMYKKIDQVYLAIEDSVAINPTDSIFIRYTSAAPPLNRIKVKTGITVNGNFPVVIDTLQDVVFIEYNFIKKTYRNNITMVRDADSVTTSFIVTNPLHFPPGDTSAATVTYKRF
jgi:hypothetical protein